MKKEKIYYLMLIIGVTLVSLINGACGDSPTTRNISFNTSSFQYICTYGQPANLTKITGLHGDSPGESRGKMRVVVKKQNNNSYDTFYDAEYTNIQVK